MSEDQQDPVSHRSILLATDISQSIIGGVVEGKVSAIAYTAYGKQSAQLEVTTRLGFNGQLQELQTEWYLLGNGYRAYNPRLMRFHSPDSWSPFSGGGLNAYMYCAGDPINHSDPTGHSIVGKFLGFFFGGSNYTGSRGTALNFGTMRPNGSGEFSGLLTTGVPIAKGHGFKKIASGKVPSPPRNNNGSDGISIGGQGNPGIDLLGFGKTMLGTRSNPSFKTGGNSVQTHSGVTANTSKTPLWNANTFANGQQPQTSTVYVVGGEILLRTKVPFS